MRQFRLLKAEEIEVRVADSSSYKTYFEHGYVRLLLYKDARCDMNILDETVGPMNWKKTYTRNNSNCILSIWDENKNQWVEKEDSGSASGNNSERDKTLASDSFKRAAVAWGIGRELYTSPKCLFPVSELNDISAEKCRESFSIKEITYKDRSIESVTIQASSGAEIIMNVDMSKSRIIKHKTPKKMPAPKIEDSEASTKAPATPKIGNFQPEEGGKVDIVNNLPFKKAI